MLKVGDKVRISIEDIELNEENNTIFELFMKNCNNKIYTVLEINDSDEIIVELDTESEFSYVFSFKGHKLEKVNLN